MEGGVIRNETQSLPGHPHVPAHVRKAGWGLPGDTSQGLTLVEARGGGAEERSLEGTFSLQLREKGLAQGYPARQEGPSSKPESWEPQAVPGPLRLC